MSGVEDHVKDAAKGYVLGALAPFLIPALIVIVVLVGFSFLLIGLNLPHGEEPHGCSESTSTSSESTPTFKESPGGSWLATSYGPPWAEGNGSGITATGINLLPAKHAYIIAVDPFVIHLGSYVHVSPNPFNKNQITFQAEDTGGAILGKHIDIYDWRGRSFQDGWGKRQVNVTPAANPGAGNILGQTEVESTPASCSTVSESGPVPLTAGQTAKILPNGNAAAPSEVPGKAGQIIKAMIAAGNEIDHASYFFGGGHGTLTHLYPAYDCSSSTSYLLYRGGLLGSSAQASGELESWGKPGPGKYLTVYANSGHVFISLAGIAFNTAAYAAPNPPGSGPRWQPGNTVPLQLSGDELGGFVARHWPGM